MIKMENVSKSYNGKKALEEVNITLSAGEIHGLVGNNGAGKTTLIKCLAGIYKADSGSVTCEDN